MMNGGDSVTSLTSWPVASEESFWSIVLAILLPTEVCMSVPKPSTVLQAERFTVQSVTANHSDPLLAFHLLCGLLPFRLRAMCGRGKDIIYATGCVRGNMGRPH